MIQVYYPYYQPSARWHELRYSLRSLDKYFKEDFSVTIVGDLPPWARNVTHIPYQRVEHGPESGLYNTLRQLQLFLSHPSTLRPALFVRMHDDTYLLSNRSLSDMQLTRIIRPAQEVKTITSGGALWRKQVMDTYSEMVEFGLPGYMTESHCPEVFDIEAMESVYSIFGLPERMLLPSTLYYNLYPWDRELIDRKEERALFYGEENLFSFLSQDIEQKCQGKFYLNHNDTGLNSEMMDFISDYFPDKSRFER